MAGPHGRSQQGHRLLGELLPNFQPLAGSQCHIAGAELIGLFAIDRSPLNLVANGEQRCVRPRLHI
jgi:hypothetical protein